MTVTATVHTPEEIAIFALTDAERAAMASWALKGYHFKFFANNSLGRRWKALDYSRPAGQIEVHTAATLYVLLCALGKPQ